MKKFIKEFKEFALKGSMFDMAIGVIMGTAVSKVVTSIVTNIFNPLIALITCQGANLVDKKFVIEGVDFTYGILINNIIEFFSTALIIFLMVKGLNKIRELGKQKEEVKVEKEPEISSTDKLLMEILDELKKEK